MSGALYLHETIDIVGQNALAYMRHTRDAVAAEKVNFVLQGTWYTMGITGRWTQVVNVWDIPSGWDGWLEAVDQLNLKRAGNTDLEQWWTEAYKFRSGGFDRLLAAAPGSPTTQQLVAAGVRGTLFVHEVAEVRPGAALDYLAEVRDIRVPLLAEYGHTVTGLYEVLFTDTEVVTVWATDAVAHVALARAEQAVRSGDATNGDDRLVAWRSARRAYAIRWREELMTPCPGTPIGPPLTDDAAA